MNREAAHQLDAEERLKNRAAQLSTKVGTRHLSAVPLLSSHATLHSNLRRQTPTLP